MVHDDMSCTLCEIGDFESRNNRHVRCATCGQDLCDACVFSILCHAMGRFRTLDTIETLLNARLGRGVKALVRAAMENTIVTCSFCQAEMDLPDTHFDNYELSLEELEMFYKNFMINCRAGLRAGRNSERKLRLARQRMFLARNTSDENVRLKLLLEQAQHKLGRRKKEIDTLMSQNLRLSEAHEAMTRRVQRVHRLTTLADTAERQ